jgi:hypothetical protein
MAVIDNRVAKLIQKEGALGNDSPLLQMKNKATN